MRISYFYGRMQYGDELFSSWFFAVYHVRTVFHFARFFPSSDAVVNELRVTVKMLCYRVSSHRVSQQEFYHITCRKPVSRLPAFALTGQVFVLDIRCQVRPQISPKTRGTGHRGGGLYSNDRHKSFNSYTFPGRIFNGHVTQPTVSRNWSKIGC